MNDIAICVEHLGKKYRIGRQLRYKTLRDTLADAASAPFRWIRSLIRRSAPGYQDNCNDVIWALRDVSFEVPRGAVVGVIGRNGAGKSTLLKILSRITEPTEGQVKINGRVGSLLEVGTGFHSELTGRENILLNGAILGMRRAEIIRKFDEIVAFSEVDKFIDTPVKHYSSGMYMRLAFSVAAHLEPAILIVDEVLAVGDAGFQKKCLGKMGDVAAEGRTVLFVSHNLAAVRSLCDKALWLTSGTIEGFGSTREITSRYLISSRGSFPKRIWENACEPRDGESVYLNRVSIRPLDGDSTGLITVESPLCVEILFQNRLPHATLNPCIEVYNAEDVCVLISFAEPQRYPGGLIQAACEIPGNLLNDLHYRLRVSIVKNGREHLVSQDGPTFEVHDMFRNSSYYGKWSGVIRPLLPWRTQVLSPEIPPVALFAPAVGTQAEVIGRQPNRPEELNP